MLLSGPSHPPSAATAASAAPSTTPTSVPAPPATGSAAAKQLSPELQAFDAWVETALAAIVEKPGPTPRGTPHPVLGPVKCRAPLEPASVRLCTSTKIVQRGRTTSVYSAKWKQDDPSVWTVATTTRHAPSLDCNRLASGSGSTIGRFRDASGTRLHCRLSPSREALISQYSSAATHRKTNLVYFSPSFPAHQPGFQRLLSPGPHR